MLGWTFVVADVMLSILGAEFLAHYNLIVDILCQRLLHASSLASTPIDAAPGSLATHVTLLTDDYASLLQQYPEVFKPELRQQPHMPSKHSVFHHIKTTGPPVIFSKYR